MLRCYQLRVCLAFRLEQFNINSIGVNCQMSSQPLWKHIGKQQVRSPESSLASNRHRKGFQINFEDQIWSTQHNQNLETLKRVDSIPENIYLSQQSMDERTPMIVTTMDIDANKFEEEQVLEAISLQSEKIQTVNLNEILSSFKDIYDKNLTFNKKPEVAQILIQSRKKQVMPSHSSTRSYLKDLIVRVSILKEQISQCKMFASRNTQQLHNFFKISASKMEQNIKKLSKNRQNELNSSKRQSMNEIVYKRQIEGIKEELQKEREKSVLCKQELQNESKKMKTRYQSKEQQRKRETQLQIVKIQQKYVSKLKKMEQELLDTKSQSDTVKHKTNKLKEEMLITKNNMQRTNEENTLLRKNLNELRDKLQDKQSIVRKGESKMALERERLQNENSHNIKENTRLKQECSRLCSLLKESEEQLKQCDEMFASLLKKNKQLQEETSKLNYRLRQVDLQYYKKLQGFDQLLSQIEGNLQKANDNHQQQKQHYHLLLHKFQKQHQKLSYRQSEVNTKQHEIQQLKKELQQQVFILLRKEEGMRDEYKKAIQAQNATKDKWYQRYYDFFPQKEEQRYYVHSPTRDTNSLPFTSKPQPKNEIFQMSNRQNVSPPKELYRIKSQKNFTINSGREGIKPKGKYFELQKPQCYKDYSITNRIDSLRKQLTKQLNLMNAH